MKDTWRVNGQMESKDQWLLDRWRDKRNSRWETYMVVSLRDGHMDGWKDDSAWMNGQWMYF